MKCKTKRKIFFLAVDALLVAAVLFDFSRDKESDEIVDDAAVDRSSDEKTGLLSDLLFYCSIFDQQPFL